MMRDDIRVPQTEHFSPGVALPLHPSIAQAALISPFARILTGVSAPQSGHLPGRLG